MVLTDTTIHPEVTTTKIRMADKLKALEQLGGTSSCLQTRWK